MATVRHIIIPSQQDLSVKDWSGRRLSSCPRHFVRGRRDPVSVPLPVAGTGRNCASSGAANADMEMSKTLCIYCKKGFTPGPEYICHLTACPSAKRPKFTLEFHEGDIMDDAYRGYSTVLAQVVDCAAVRPFGVSKVLTDKYPFSSAYHDRRQVGAFNRALPEDRAVPGTIAVHKSRLHVHDPLVVNMFAQFYSGKSFEDNAGSQNLVRHLRQTSRNEYRKGTGGFSRRGDDFADGLQSDTQANRNRWFQECLGQLEQVVRRTYVQKVVFLYKIENGLSLSDWERHYVPAIRGFFDNVSRRNVNVVVLNVDQKSRK
ncbi:uncharacterized protein [Macrobrachium rosenbergii]|uniref:uncharacterized protein n=1 Tax=Macrobrachium rosenbergii TaxID=79674 RepID=UPI0034D3FC13